jgi:hypothetical protein
MVQTSCVMLPILYATYKTKVGCRCSPVSIVTELRAERPGFDSQRWQGLFSLRHYDQTGPGVNPAAYLMGTRRYSGRDMNQTTNLHLEPRLRIRGARRLLWYLVKHRDERYQPTDTDILRMYFLLLYLWSWCSFIANKPVQNIS